MKPKKMKMSASEKALIYGIHLIVLLLSLVCLIPLFYTVSASISSGSALDAGKVFLWPVGFNLDAYKLLLTKHNIVRYFANSTFLTVVGTVLSLFCTILCAYPLSKKYLFRRRTISFFITFTMLFGGGMIPTFLQVRNLGLMNSYWAIWLTSLISPYNMMVMRSFFDGIPEELDESAKIDGCGEWRLLFQIYLPLSKAVLATETLFYGVSYWNTYQRIMLYIQDTKKYTLPVFIQQIVFQLQQLDTDTVDAVNAGITDVVSEGVKSAGVVVLIVPMLLVYPFLQKYFVKGVTLGAVKG